jgi:signal peptidase II
MSRAPGPAEAWARALAVTAVVVLVDQATKAAVVAGFAPGQSDNVFLGIDLTYVKNDGIAFGALGGGGPAIIVLVAISMALLVAYFARHAANPWLWLPVGTILGGALGNVADRARTGKVVDFIDPIAWPAFNLADAFIVVGVVGFVLVVGGDRRAPGAGR